MCDMLRMLMHDVCAAMCALPCVRCVGWVLGVCAGFQVLSEDQGGFGGVTQYLLEEVGGCKRCPIQPPRLSHAAL